MAKPRVLLIDDSEEIHLIVQKTLTDLCEVKSVLNSSEAKKVFGTNPFAIVIIDLMLGNQNGLDLLRAFKQDPGINQKFSFLHSHRQR
jgi:CheY-like chemotaxis protein